jgi:hypothetical protein
MFKSYVCQVVKACVVDVLDDCFMNVHVYVEYVCYVLIMFTYVLRICLRIYLTQILILHHPSDQTTSAGRLQVRTTPK